MALLLLLALAWSASGAAATRAAMDQRDVEFLNRAAAASATELKIARMAAQSAGTAEVRALARRLITFNARMRAALRELARARAVKLEEKPDSAARKTLARFEGKTGRTYDALFREYLLTDPLGLIGLYATGAAEVKDPLARRLAERTYGELKRRRPAAATAYLRARISAARKAGKARAVTPAKVAKPKNAKPAKPKAAQAKPAKAKPAKAPATKMTTAKKASSKAPPRAKVVAWPRNSAAQRPPGIPLRSSAQ